MCFVFGINIRFRFPQSARRSEQTPREGRPNHRTRVFNQQDGTSPSARSHRASRERYRTGYDLSTRALSPRSVCFRSLPASAETASGRAPSRPVFALHPDRARQARAESFLYLPAAPPIPASAASHSRPAVFRPSPAKPQPAVFLHPRYPRFHPPEPPFPPTVPAHRFPSIRSPGTSPGNQPCARRFRSTGTSPRTQPQKPEKTMRPEGIEPSTLGLRVPCSAS